MLNPHHQRLALVLILLTYLTIGALYAALTPDWQVPDEPAHYNYIRQLAAGRLPVIEPGDYDPTYLEKLKAERFPLHYPLSSIQYEDHQPPLYYLLATPLFGLSDGVLFPLRLFSLLLGAGVILLAYRIGVRVFPGRPLLTFTAVALIAFIPQHIAMMAGVNNDSLAELLLAAALLGMVTIHQGGKDFYPPAYQAKASPPSVPPAYGGEGLAGLRPPRFPCSEGVCDPDSATRDAGQCAAYPNGCRPAGSKKPGIRTWLDTCGGKDFYPWLLGLLLGAIFATKIQAYIAAPVLGLAILIRWQRERESVSWLLRWLVGVFGPALLIGALWWGRNIVVYGGLDWMGLGRHNAVVLGQPTTAGWIANFGLPALLGRFLQFTFQSFWGMFGWMGVIMDARVYQALAVLTAVTVLGFCLAVIRKSGDLGKRSSNLPIRFLLALSALLTASGYLWYNLSFVQHQGRYLFPALVPLGLAAGVGWERLTRTRPARIAAAVLLAAAVGVFVLGGYAYLALLCGGAAGLLWLNTWLLPRFRWLLPAAVGLGLAVLSFASLFLFVIPGLN